MKVAVLDDYQGVAPSLADWASLGPEVEVRFHRDHVADADALVARLADVDAVVVMRERTPFPREVLARLPRLALLVTPGMRNAAVDLAAARELGVVVSGTPGSAGSTAELTWALILAVVRSVPAEDAALRAGAWQTTVGVDLEGRTLGVLGLGKLGRRVARVGLAFGMRVVAWSQNLTAEAAAEAGVVRVERGELFRQADVLTVHLVLGDRTRGLVGAAELGLMKPTAYLVNTSRGPIVDSDALVAALTERRLGGAGLDVFDTEPLPADAPIRHAPRTVLTPHLGFVTEDVLRTWYGGAVEDLAAYRAGAPIRVLEPPAV